MIALFVVFQLKPGTRDQFIALSMSNARGSIDGPGCCATSILPDPERPNVAYTFEVFVDQQAFDDHHAQPYYTRWLAETEPLMAEPYEMLQSTTFPDDESFRHLRLAVAGSMDPASWPASRLQ